MIEKAELHVPRARRTRRRQRTCVILAVQRVAGSGHERVVVEVAAPEGAPVDLFVEGPTPEWALPIPEQTGTAAARSPLHVRSRRPAAGARPRM